MSFAPVGDLARNLMIRRHTTQIKSDLDQLAAMMASGRKRDLAGSLRGNLAPLNGVETNLARLEGWQLATTGLSARMEAMQAAFTSMRALGDAGAKSFLHAKLPEQIAIAAKDSLTTLETLLGHLNTRVGDAWILAGTSSDAPAVGTADEVLAALLPLVSALSKPEEVAAQVLDWIRDPGGFAATLYRGGPPTAAITLSPHDHIAHGITAADPGFAKLLAAAALGALLDRGLFATDSAARTQTGELTAELYLTSASDSIHLASRLGQSQSHLDRAATRNLAERSALMILRNETLRAEPEQTAADLTATSLQLELLFAMTARLSSLTLLNALR